MMQWTEEEFEQILLERMRFNQYFRTFVYDVDTIKEFAYDPRTPDAYSDKFHRMLLSFRTYTVNIK